MRKDRRREIPLAPDVSIIVHRSSTHPVEYAITLVALRDGTWRTVRSFDNAHQAEEHHEHRYKGTEKQQPSVTHGPVNDAMHAIQLKLETGWYDILRSWESTL